VSTIKTLKLLNKLHYNKSEKKLQSSQNLTRLRINVCWIGDIKASWLACIAGPIARVLLLKYCRVIIATLFQLFLYMLDSTQMKVSESWWMTIANHHQLVQHILSFLYTLHRWKCQFTVQLITLCLLVDSWFNVFFIQLKSFIWCLTIVLLSSRYFHSCIFSRPHDSNSGWDFRLIAAACQQQ